jgi:hypothetical protein
MKKLLVPLLLLLSGCSRSGLVSASGRITYKGEPVPSTQVTFLPADGGRPSHGLTDDNGNFQLSYSRTEKGVSRGQHTVLLTYHVGNEEYLGKAKPKASPELKRVIAKYGDAKRSPLQIEINSSGQFVDIKLE